MDIERVNSKANAGLTTGIIGTAGLGLGLLGSMLFGGNGGMGSMLASGLCSAIPSAIDNAVGRPELEHRLADIQTIAAKDSQIAELKMNSLMDSKVLDLYKYVEGKFHEQDRKFADQGIWNATQTGTIGSIGGQIHDLEHAIYGLTKRVIPAENVCPEPMARYNSWTAPVAATAPVTGA